MLMSTINSSLLSFRTQNSINNRAAMANSLFGSLNTGQNNLLGNYSFADLSSIRNGSYAKLVKAAYSAEGVGKTSSDKKKETTDKTTRSMTGYEKSGALDKLLSTYKTDSTSKTASNKTSEENVDLATAAKSLASAVKDIEKLETDDMDVAADAVQKFVDYYNKTVKAGLNSDVSSVARNTTWMSGVSESRSSRLAQVGITVNSDKSLSFDREVFKNADDSTINTLFAADDPNTLYADSYISEIGDRAENIASLAATEGNSQTTYTGTGQYSSAASGTAFDIDI
jgi:hypothetical protein